MRNSSFLFFRGMLFLLFITLSGKVMAQEEIVVDSTVIAMDTVAVTSDQTVEEEKQDEDPFINTDKQAEITPRRLPPGTIEKIKKEKKYWFADSAFVEKKKEKGYHTPFFMRDWVKIVFWILVVTAFTLALVWYLYQNNIRLFRKKDIAVPDATAEELPENIFEIDHQAALARALAAGDLRLAVRLKFIGLLKKLAEKELIQYRPDRTNMDYLFQLGNKQFYPDFFRVVRHYEYCWYGQFAVHADTYGRIADDFEKLEGKLS